MVRIWTLNLNNDSYLVIAAQIATNYHILFSIEKHILARDSVGVNIQIIYIHGLALNFRIFSKNNGCLISLK
jgi:hypothetical protein